MKMRFSTTTRGFSLVLLLGACALGCTQGSPSTEEEPASGPEARALSNLRMQPGQVLADLDHTFEVRDVIVDRDGREHVRLDRRYKGLRVLGGDVVVHGRVDGSLDSVSMTLQRAVTLDVVPELD